MQIVNVVAGVIERNENEGKEFFIALRPENAPNGGFWEFPGGKVESFDVDYRAALKRELHEEFKIELNYISNDPISITELEGDTVKYVIHFYLCTLVDGCEPELLEHDDMRFVYVGDLLNFNLSKTNIKVAKLLQIFN